MKNILFIGAGGFASECFLTLQDIMKLDATICCKGFLSTSNDLAPYGLEHLFLGHYDDYDFKEDDYVVIAIGSCKARRKVYEQLKSRGVKFYNLISPHALVYTKHIGEANIIACFSSAAGNAVIGNCNVLNAYSGMAHDTVIGDFNVISAHTDICGFVSIGNGNFSGSNVSFLPKCKIGNNNVISAGSVVFKGCKDNVVMQGNPAMKVCSADEL